MSTNEHSSYDAPVVAVLTYHSVNVGPPEYARNDHVALATDLRRLHAAGFRFEPLDSVVDWHSGLREFPRDARIAVISFDDGATLDFEPENYPGFGLQPGFAAVLRGFLDEVGPAVQAGLRATAFVIADPHTRRRLETHNFDGRRWLADDWWAQAEAGGLIRVQNHSWDHMHAVADRVCGPNDRRGDFTAVARDADCACEIVQAARYIQSRVGGGERERGRSQRGYLGRLVDLDNVESPACPTQHRPACQLVDRRRGPGGGV